MKNGARSFRLRKEARPFGAFLKRQRTYQRLSVRGLAERAAISSAYLSQVENGKRNPPAPNQLRKLAPHLHVRLTALMERAGYAKVKDHKSARQLEVDAAFRHVLADPLVRERGIRPPDGLTPEAKQLVVQVYAAATNQSL